MNWFSLKRQTRGSPYKRQTETFLFFQLIQKYVSKVVQRSRWKLSRFPEKKKKNWIHIPLHLSPTGTRQTIKDSKQKNFESKETKRTLSKSKRDVVTQKAQGNRLQTGPAAKFSLATSLVLL